MTDEQVIEIRKSLPFAHDKQWADTINFARAIAKAERGACIEAIDRVLKKRKNSCCGETVAICQEVIAMHERV